MSWPVSSVPELAHASSTLSDATWLPDLHPESSLAPQANGSLVAGMEASQREGEIARFCDFYLL